jgi:hypothetical protein
VRQAVVEPLERAGFHPVARNANAHVHQEHFSASGAETGSASGQIQPLNSRVEGRGEPGLRFSASVKVAKCCGEIVDFCSLADGEAGEEREKRRVCPLAARVGCDASEVQNCLSCVLLDGQVVKNEARGSSKRITGCGEPGVDRRQSTRRLNTVPLASGSPSACRGQEVCRGSGR